MVIRKNALTTSRVGRLGRTVHRRTTRLLVRETVIATRRARHSRWAHIPDYLIVGVQKGGTTALFDALTAEEDFGTPLVKEVHYFNRFAARHSFDWYRNHFWGATPGVVWGESTPAYFDAPNIPDRVASALPDVKVVITLRDPLARAISHYFHAVDFGMESRSMAEAFAEEIAVLRAGGWTSVDDLQQRGYLARSRYTTPVRRWQDALPAEQIKVVVAEQRSTSLADVGQFLAPWRDTDWTVHDSNARAYQVPESVDFIPALEILRADCESLQRLVGWPQLPAEWTSVCT